MAGIFLSHSSADKLFVRKLAIGLATDGFPVWFDSWELEIGDHLHREIEEGIDESTFLVVVLSKNSTSSEWVDRELSRALERERQLGKKFVIPIVIDDCSIPIAVANRIYANFCDKPFQTALEQLAEVMEKRGGKSIAVDPKRRIVPLVFTKGVFLNKQVLDDSLKYVPKEHVFDLTQLVLGGDEQYEALRVKLQRALGEVANWPEYTPELEQAVNYNYKYVKLLEGGLLSGMKQVLEHMRPYGYREPAFWFARIIREELLSTLWGSQRRDSGEVIDYGREHRRAFGSNDSAAQFYGVAKVDRVQCFPRDWSGYFGAWIDAGSRTAQDLHDFIGAPEPLLGVCSPDVIDKYLIPQMLYSNLMNSRDPVSFDFKDYMIGLA